MDISDWLDNTVTMTISWMSSDNALPRKVYHKLPDVTAQRYKHVTMATVTFPCQPSHSRPLITTLKRIPSHTNLDQEKVNDFNWNAMK